MVDAKKIEKALAQTGTIMTSEDLILAATEGLVRIFREKQSLVIVSVNHDKALVFHLAAGDLGDVLLAVEVAKAWGRDQEATRAVFIGRRGWRKVLRGWTVRNRLYLYEQSL
jgi:hypothetical protein